MGAPSGTASSNRLLINSTTTFSGLSETTRFRRMVISELGGNNSCEASTGYVVVTVATPPVVNNQTTICASVTFEATGHELVLTVTGTTSTSIQFDPLQVTLWPTEITSGWL